MIDFFLEKKKLYCLINGVTYGDIHFIHHFPITQPFGCFVSIVDDKNNLIYYVHTIDELDEKQIDIIMPTLKDSFLIKHIDEIISINKKIFPSIWKVKIGEQEKRLTIESANNLISLSNNKVLIKNNEKKYYLISSLSHLNNHSKKLLRPYMYIISD
jgi:hypothetical protein